MPSGAVEEQDGMRALGDMAADLVDVQLHGFGVGMRQHEGCRFATRRTDGTEEIGVLVALVGRLSWSRATLCPLPDDAVLLAYAGFVLWDGSPPPRRIRLVVQ